jgi:hypothetical protein
MPMPESGSPDAQELLSGITPYTDDEFRQLLKLRRPIPIARYQNELEAKAVLDKLLTLNLPVKLISDKDLQLDTPCYRIKRLAIEVTDGLKLTISQENMPEKTEQISAKDIRLIVEGKIRQRQLDAVEENKSFGNTKRELADTVEFIDEQPILDLYTNSSAINFRVRANAFDYSGLGDKMKLTTLENFRMLATILRDIATTAQQDSDFKHCCRWLEAVWPSIKRVESRGLRRSKLLGAGKISTQTSYYSDNELQFNRYSRLCYHLLPPA